MRLRFVLWMRESAAERLEVQPPTVSRMVRRMERTGLVERRTSPEDQRVSIVHATDKGRSVRADIEQVWKTMEAEMTEGMSGAETTAFRTMLARVRSNLGRGRDGTESLG